MHNRFIKNLWNFFTPADKILIGILLVISLLSWVWANQLARIGTLVEVWIDNQEVGHFILDEDRMITLQGPLGETLVQIKNKRVTIIESACPNKICCQMAAIHRIGQVIVCVPNRVVVKITGETVSEPWDVITE